MRVLFTSLRTTSHFLPLVPFIQACLKKGHEVAVAAPQELAQRAKEAGALFFPVGHPGDEKLRPLWTRMHEVSPKEAESIVISEIFAGACAEAALPALMQIAAQWKPAVVVRESQEYASVLVTEKLGIPRARVSIMLRSVERGLVSVAAPVVDAHGARLGSPRDPTGQRMLSETSLTQFPASFDALAEEQASVLRFRADRKPAGALPAWWGERQGPLVYVTLGTVAGSMERAHTAYVRALDAVRTLPVRVLLTVGAEFPLAALGELPEHVHVERFVPQDEVLPHAAAVLCHGGSGTVVGTLAAGVPMLVMPLFADQPDNAQRVNEVHAGIGLSANSELNAEELRAALVRVLEEPSFRDTARRIAGEVAGLTPVGEAAAELERLT